jgi:hypothetical protein
MLPSSSTRHSLEPPTRPYSHGDADKEAGGKVQAPRHVDGDLEAKGKVQAPRHAGGDREAKGKVQRDHQSTHPYRGITRTKDNAR